MVWSLGIELALLNGGSVEVVLMRGTFVLMRCLLSAAFVILAASFSSTPKPAPYEAPEGLVLVRDSYQLENANHPMIGFTPDSPGPHKLIVVLTGVNQPLDDKSFAIRRGALEKAVAVQGHGMVIVETPGFDLYPDFAGAAEFFASNLSGAREVMCADWVQKGTGVIAGIHKLCARDDFDCSSGIALHGGSMGAGIAVQTSKLLTTPTVNALLTTQWAPLLGGGSQSSNRSTPMEALTCSPRTPSRLTGAASTTRVPTRPVGRPLCHWRSTRPPCPPSWTRPSGCR